MDEPPEAYTFAETDYLYGVGPLALRIERVDRDHPVRYDADTWLQVDGVQLDYRGIEIGHRSALIRTRRLPTAVLTGWPDAHRHLPAATTARATSGSRSSGRNR